MLNDDDYCRSKKIKTNLWNTKNILMKPQIVIACDHAGFDTKVELIKYLESIGYELIDLGTNSTESVDYPDYGHKLGENIESGKYKMGISLCGSGNGINMVVNKHRGVRAALCWSVEISELARKHNDANVCSIPARFVDINESLEIVKVFLNTKFEGGRHERRKNKIDT